MRKMKILIILALLQPFILSATDIKVYFSPEDKIDRIILENIKQAKKSVYIVSYSFNWDEGLESLNKIAEYGVNVKVLLQFPPSNTYKENKKALIKLWNKKSSVLHAKFVVIDEKYVFVGSPNLTESSLAWDSNNILFIKDNNIGKFFSENFLSLWSRMPDSNLKNYKDNSIEIYFSPEYDCLSIIKDNINNAKQTLRFAMFSFTLDEIGEEMFIAGFKGIKIYGIFEKSQNPISNEYYFLKNFPFIKIKKDCFVKNIHDKFLVIDDNIVLTGSFNYTQSARKNVETLIVLKDNRIASEYIKRWKHLWLWY